MVTSLKLSTLCTCEQQQAAHPDASKSLPDSPPRSSAPHAWQSELVANREFTPCPASPWDLLSVHGYEPKTLLCSPLLRTRNIVVVLY